ncbi:MAG: DEAD/DEAH box helicase family protein [Armatimonadota bacterium]
MERDLSELASALEKDTLNALAWTVADEVLEFRFAVPRSWDAGSNYHDKVWVFVDEVGDRVALHGSFNDSRQASLNGEAVSVFKSWEPAHADFVAMHHNRLQDLWDNRNGQFATYTVPQAIRDRIVRLRSTVTRPYPVPGISLETSERYPSPNCPIGLRPYQLDAVKAWVNAGCRGVFEMATGTGKTYTALAAAVDRYKALGRLALIVLVPYLHLLDQWADDCCRFGFAPILCSGTHRAWPVEVASRINDFRIGVPSHLCILAVHDTASTSKFARVIGKLPSQSTMLVGDEVHRLGATCRRQALTEVAGLRLGLSATPYRWFDEEGTREIFSYFGKTCFEFPLDEAIRCGFLTPYQYLPELVNLSDEEEAEYGALTSEIGKLIDLSDEDPEASDRLEKLLIKRARIVASAQGKLPALVKTLRDKISEAVAKGEELSHLLIYCAPGCHRQYLEAISGMGLRCHEFVHTVSRSDRQVILDQFERGDLQALVAVRCLDEGVDVPATKLAFLLASRREVKFHQLSSSRKDERFFGSIGLARSLWRSCLSTW